MRRLLALVLMFAALAPSEASAFELVDNDDLRARVVTWARAGWQLQLDEAGNLNQGPYLDLARILLDSEFRVDGNPLGRGFVNVAGKSGTFQLLDVFGEVNLGDHVAIRVGRDRTTTSASFLVPAPFIAFANRELITSEGYLVTRANGAGVRFKTRLGDEEDPHNLALDLHALVRDDGTPGNMVTVRALYEWDGLMVHVALQEQVHGEAGRVVDENRQLALAGFWEKNGWTARGEVLAVLDAVPGTYTFGLPVVLHTELLRAFEVGPEDRTVTLEPAVRYDISVRDGSVQRATAGLNVYLLGHQLKSQLNYDLRIDGVDVSHAIFANLQGGL